MVLDAFMFGYLDNDAACRDRVVRESLLDLSAAAGGTQRRHGSSREIDEQKTTARTGGELADDDFGSRKFQLARHVDFMCGGEQRSRQVHVGSGRTTNEPFVGEDLTPSNVDDRLKHAVQRTVGKDRLEHRWGRLRGRHLPGENLVSV
jgi:hypothetical protein